MAWKELRLIDLAVRFENYTKRPLRFAADQVGAELVIKVHEERFEKDAPTIITADSDGFIVPAKRSSPDGG
jgi:hypothetical protein